MLQVVFFRDVSAIRQIAGIGAGPLLLDEVDFACRIASLGLTRGVLTGRSFMRIRRITIAGAFGVGLAALPLSTATAQYYPACSPFLLSGCFARCALFSAPPQ